MTRISWLYDASLTSVEHAPKTAEEAIARLDAGNAEFASLDPGADEPHVHRVSADELGFGAVPGVPPTQAPYAAMLGCADARAPLELLFMQSANDLFAVRVAGNVLGAECVGSLDFAVENLASVRLLAVVGHTGCGAVTAAVDAYLDPTTHLHRSANLPLRAIVDAILPAVRAADRNLLRAHGASVGDRPGFRAALIDTAVVIHAVSCAATLAQLYGTRQGVAAGVYDLTSRTVGLPARQDGGPTWQPGLAVPPKERDFKELLADVASSQHVRTILERT